MTYASLRSEGQAPPEQNRIAVYRGLAPNLANQVARYAKTVAALVRIGLESQKDGKRDFFRRLKENLANDDPNQQDRLVDEFRTLILGR